VATNSDVPPTPTVKPVDPPPPSDQPTSAMLKADIDSGRTGDKVGVLDPGLSSLGTDDEAAGRPPSPFRIALARYQETLQQWSSGRPDAGAAHQDQDGGLAVFLGLVVTIGVVLLVGIWAAAR
jgi:hypothetical protein